MSGYMVGFGDIREDAAELLNMARAAGNAELVQNFTAFIEALNETARAFVRAVAEANGKPAEADTYAVALDSLLRDGLVEWRSYDGGDTWSLHPAQEEAPHLLH